MIAMSLREIAQTVDGVIEPPEAEGVRVDGPVVTDSRQSGPGGLYVARIGEHADGHDFVGDAASRGAVAALTSRAVPGLPCIVVKDTQDAFAALARALIGLRGDELTVIGITGSSGKTSTKDMLRQVLESAGDTVATMGSLNSEVGVPLTVARITATTRFLVVEMGARGSGHIRYLTEVAAPSIGVVLNVGLAHVGEFGDVAGVAKAKAELVEALPSAPGGVAVLNADDMAVDAMSSLTTAAVRRFGTASDADIRAESISIDEAGHPRFTAHVDGEQTQVHLTELVGEHNVSNALAVIGVALECGLSLQAIAQVLSTASIESRWRMEVTTTNDGITLVNDAYNANPDSMRAAIAAVGQMATTGRRWAVLGAMLELGPDSDALHADAGVEVERAGFDELLTVGAAAEAIGDRLGSAPGSLRVRHVDDREAAYSLLRAELRRNDVVLFKSSHGVGLRFLGDRLAAEGEGPT